MNQNIDILIKKFEIIREQGLHESLRNGNTGIGYTFESLIGKQEDTDYAPDYNGIEIKTKLGYSKCPMTLFSLVPKSNEINTISKMVETYGYPDKTFRQFKVLRANAHATKNIPVQNKYIFKLYVDWESQRLKLLITNNSNHLLSSNIYWDFDELKERLCKKLNYMALVIGYPYRYSEVVYYKYFKMTIYKLKSFETFLRLIEAGEISVIFNIGIYKTADKFGAVYDHGTSFKLSTSCIYKLFDKIKTV